MIPAETRARAERPPRLRVVAEPPTDAERVIWRRLADELDAWLDSGDGQEVLL